MHKRHIAPLRSPAVEPTVALTAAVVLAVTRSGLASSCSEIVLMRPYPVTRGAKPHRRVFSPERRVIKGSKGQGKLIRNIESRCEGPVFKTNHKSCNVSGGSVRRTIVA